MLNNVRRQLTRWAIFTLVVIIIDVAFPAKDQEPLNPCDLLVDAGIAGGVMLGTDVLNAFAG